MQELVNSIENNNNNPFKPPFGQGYILCDRTHFTRVKLRSKSYASIRYGTNWASVGRYNMGYQSRLVQTDLRSMFVYHPIDRWIIIISRFNFKAEVDMDEQLFIELIRSDTTRSFLSYFPQVSREGCFISSRNLFYSLFYLTLPTLSYLSIYSALVDDLCKRNLCQIL